GPSIVKEYRDRFRDAEPKVMVTVNVICAETTEEAMELAKSNQVWKLMQSKGEGNGKVPTVKEALEYNFSDEDLDSLRTSNHRQIIGNPREVRESLEELREL